MFFDVSVYERYINDVCVICIYIYTYSFICVYIVCIYIFVYAYICMIYDIYVWYRMDPHGISYIGNLPSLWRIRGRGCKCRCAQTLHPETGGLKCCAQPNRVGMKSLSSPRRFSTEANRGLIKSQQCLSLEQLDFLRTFTKDFHQVFCNVEILNAEDSKRASSLHRRTMITVHIIGMLSQ